MIKRDNEIKENTGFVTFADILGWKGIWYKNNSKNPIIKLLDIKARLLSLSFGLRIQYYIQLFKKYFKDMFPEEKLNNIEREFMSLKKSKNEKTYAEFIKRVGQISIDRKKINNLMEEYKVNISIELISDTFVITSSSDKIEYELLIHSRIAHEIIVACLEQDLLVRGATSYGRYFNRESVFVGEAIDDAASWHEIGDEIGIFFTPKAYNITEKVCKRGDIIIDEWDLEKLLYDTKPKLKIKPFETHIINWKNGGKSFERIVDNYPTILPDIYLKIINSKKRLFEFNVDNANILPTSSKL